MDFTKHVIDRKKTPQTKKVPGVQNQKKNNAGGISFKMDMWDYLKRFLIIGTENGTYYVGEKKLTADALDNVRKCIKEDGFKAVNMIVDISKEGRGADNDFAIFALAMAASAKDKSTRAYALSKLDEVCRIGTHLFHFVKFVKTQRGFGRGLRNALANWYTSKDITKLAYQMLKYQGRDGWTHGDVIRLAHPVPFTDDINDLFAYATGNRQFIPEVSKYAKGMLLVQAARKEDEVAQVVRDYSLTHEAVPTHFYGSVKVWEAMFEEMPMMAMIRNLGKMASLGMHDSFSEISKETVRRLTDETRVKRSKVHPIAIMNAMLIYKAGHAIKGSLTWVPDRKIIDALEDCFYLSFKNVEPTGKKIMLALDVSGSMTQQINRSYMSCRVASAVLAMVTMRSEQNTDIIGFTERGHGPIMKTGGRGWWPSSAVTRLNLSSRASLTETVNTISGLPFAGTDCALPMIYCDRNNIDVDAVVIYTDNETLAGNIHPWQALDQLQQKLGHEVKCSVVGMTSTGFSIARHDYSNMMDVVGMDTNTPAIISDFIRD